MCGIVGIVGQNLSEETLRKLLSVQCHRGPDSIGVFVSPSGKAALGHNRLSILDLSDAGNQPMSDITGRYWIVFNGEVYNYLEIRTQLEADFNFRTGTDTEVLLYSYIKWGDACLDKFIGMFSFAIWDEREQTLFAARDRFGVKPFYFAFDLQNNFLFSSEIKTLHAGGISAEPNDEVWAGYLGYGRYDNGTDSFWKNIHQLPAGHTLKWAPGGVKIKQWYNLAEKAGKAFDERPIEEVMEEYFTLLQDTIRLRFRADVPVGINLSGGLDSSTLLHLVDKVQGSENPVKAFTFITGDERYDELPWVREMISATNHELITCLLRAEDVPSLAASVQQVQDEPFGGFPTLAYARVFEEARKNGIIVLLDGQGMDEQWAGYDYYRKTGTSLASPTVQGTTDSPVRPDCLNEDFLATAKPSFYPEPFTDKLRNLQYRDTFYTKIPRALRFNDRVSMRSSTELREPFLDHRLFELAFRQSAERKINGEQGKWFMRQLVQKHLPGKIVEAPKRALQTPQREWLRNELRDWAEASIQEATKLFPHWLKKEAVESAWGEFVNEKSDNSFYVWQWISLQLLTDAFKKHKLQEVKTY